MPVSTPPAAPGPSAPPAAAAFLALMPGVVAAARRQFRHVRCPDRRQDLVCEAVALGWLWHLRLVARGRDPAVFANTFAALAAQAVYAGRRLCGCERAKDALSPACQRRRSFTVSPLPDGSSMDGSAVSEALHDNTLLAAAGLGLGVGLVGVLGGPAARTAVAVLAAAADLLAAADALGDGAARLDHL